MQVEEPITHQLALLVGEDPEVEQILRKMLEPQGWHIELADNHAAALEQVKLREFSFIVTAGHASGADDLALLRQMRGVHPHTRMIIVVEESTPQDVLESMREQAFSYFVRPISEPAFQQIINLAMNCPCWDDGIEVASATPDWIILHVRCDVPTADRLIQFMREVTHLPEKEGREAGVAFREILLNAMEHGGHFDPQQYVEISYVRTRRGVACRIKDPGKGFTLEELKYSALCNPPDDPLHHAALRERQGLRPGGYGVLLARHFVDEMLYNEQGNEVILVKYLDRARN